MSGSLEYDNDYRFVADTELLSFAAWYWLHYGTLLSKQLAIGVLRGNKKHVLHERYQAWVKHKHSRE